MVNQPTNQQTNQSTTDPLKAKARDNVAGGSCSVDALMAPDCGLLPLLSPLPVPTPMTRNGRNGSLRALPPWASDYSSSTASAGTSAEAGSSSDFAPSSAQRKGGGAAPSRGRGNWVIAAPTNAGKTAIFIEITK